MAARLTPAAGRCGWHTSPSSSTASHVIRLFARFRQPGSLLKNPLHQQSVSSRSRSSSASHPAHLFQASSSSTSAATMSDQPSSLKARLAQGHRLYGASFCSSSPPLAEIMGYCGFDYVVVDMEHGPGSTLDALPCLQALKAAGAFSVIRIPVNDPTWAKKALDLGPDGIMIPMVQTAEEAVMAVAACRYPPKGIRGAACGIIRASRYGLDINYPAKVEDSLLIMLQIESEKGVENVAEIAAIDGVDCIMMGARDLSYSMGLCDNLAKEHEVDKLLHQAEAAALAVPKSTQVYLAGVTRASDPPPSMYERGYQMVGGCGDLSLFREAALANVRKYKPGPK
ncbi:hypothetical protein L7F22_003499 [Adiantum nelumboides]|nr:hypothetical protein [Adiantum nelumboides]